jgi:hypothetical protein
MILTTALMVYRAVEILKVRTAVIPDSGGTAADKQMRISAGTNRDYAAFRFQQGPPGRRYQSPAATTRGSAVGGIAAGHYLQV